MKKILTFLVMLVASVSFLMAQAPQAKFNYQAVVRDRINDDNLVMNQSVDVLVEIINFIDNQESVVYAEQHSAETNRNGMVSLIIGEGDVVSQADATTSDNVTPSLDNVDWGNAIIRATFSIGDQTLSVVENPVMAVPYALQANVDPLKITTEEIVKYIQHAEGTDVKAIYDAMVSNQSVSKAVRDSIVSYVKTQDSLAKALAIYFLHTVNADDVEAARDTLTQSAKNAIKNIVIDYLKANKDAAYDVLGYYLTNTTVEDADALWNALRDNSQFDTIFTQVRDKAINYIKNNKDLVLGLVYYYIDEVITSEDVDGLHNRLKQNTQVYNYMLGKFNDYLDYYIGDNYLRDAECGVNLCELKEQLEQLKNGCPEISSASYTLTTGPLTYHFTVNLTNANQLLNENQKIYTNVLNVKLGDEYLFQSGEYVNLQWNVNNGVATISYQYPGGSTPSNPEFTVVLHSCSTTFTKPATLSTATTTGN